MSLTTRCPHHPPVSPLILDFLAPSIPQSSLHRLAIHHHHNHHRSRAQYSTTPKLTGTLTPSQSAYLSRALRINHAGETAATLIYTSQTPSLVRTHPHLQTLMKHMYAQEAAHLSTFNQLLTRHRIRPSLLLPLWGVAARILGWSTGLMGREAAMACTEAVETEIGGHYNDQVRVLVGWQREMEERGEVFPQELEELLVDVRRIRDEELEHLDCALEEDARSAKGWPVLTAVIRGGCRAAIQVAGKV